MGVEVDDRRARELWDGIQAAARTPEELALGRDLSAEAHRRRWTALYGAADIVAPGMAERLYNMEQDPLRWEPYSDTLGVLRHLHAAGVGLGIVSDTGWDIRPVLEHHRILDLFDTVVLSCEHGASKPAVALFEAACADLGVDAASTLMVGDNPLTDGGAVNAGLTALVLPRWDGAGPRGIAAVLGLV